MIAFEGVTLTLSPAGGLRVMGLDTLPPDEAGRVVAMVKANRERLLAELKGGKPKACNIRRPPGQAEVARYRQGRAWCLDHLGTLLASGWTRAGLFRAGRYRYPYGPWGAAWLWPVDVVDVSMLPGCLAFHLPGGATLTAGREAYQ